MSLAPGATFPDNVVTATKMNALVDDATLTGVTTSKLVSGSSLFNNLAPSGLPGSDGENYIDANGFLNYQDGSAYIKDDTVSWIVTLTNGAAVNMIAGDVVVSGPDGDDEFQVAYDPTAVKADARVFGVLAEDIATGAAGQVVYRGLVTCKVIVSPAVGSWLYSPFVSLTNANSADPTVWSTSNASSFFGYTVSEASGGFVTAWIWR